jgi:hypothetical protein
MEGFFTEWVVRCVAMDTSTLRATLESKASNYLTAQLPSWRNLPPAYQTMLSATASLPIPPRLSHEQVRSLLDCQNDNLSIRGIADLDVLARDNIADVRGSYIGKVATDEAKVVDATVAIRNVLVHRTERARAALNQALQSSGLSRSLRRNQNLGSGDNSVGRYLCAKPVGGSFRFEEFFAALGAVAIKLAPYRGAPVTICP